MFLVLQRGFYAYLIDFRKNLHMTAFRQKEVGKNNQRNQTIAIAKLYLGKKTMAKQAKTLTATEQRRVLDYIATHKHSARNRAMFMLQFYAGLRVGETAELRIADAVSTDGEVKREILLKSSITKGGVARTIFVSDKLHKELSNYIKTISIADRNSKLFYSQKRGSDGFNPNTLTQHWHHLFRKCHIDNASSHSLRRSFATEIANKGVGIKVLQKLLGHKNIQTTSVYIFASDEQLRKAVNLV